MEKIEWNNIRAGDIIYTIRGGNPRTVIRANQNGSGCIALENGTVYASCDKYYFTLTKPFQINKKVRKAYKKVKKFLLS